MTDQTELKRTYAITLDVVSGVLASGADLDTFDVPAFVAREVAVLKECFAILDDDLQRVNNRAIRARAHTLPHPDHFTFILEYRARNGQGALARRLAFADAALTLAHRDRSSMRAMHIAAAHHARALILIDMRRFDAARRALRAARRNDHERDGVATHLWLRARLCTALGRAAEAARLRRQAQELDRELLATLRTTMLLPDRFSRALAHTAGEA